MKIEKKTSVIATIKFPLQFLDINFDMVDSIEDAALYDCDKIDVELQARQLDEPDDFQVLDVKVTYEF